MNPPPVQYLTTTDGKSIAYAVCGQGEALVFVPALFGHVNLGWNLYSSWFDAFACRFRFLHYDGRGSGLSSRNLDAAHSMSDWQSDLEAIIDAMGFPQVTLFGGCHAGHIAVRYALKHPNRVRALILNMVSVQQKAWGEAFWTTVSSQNWNFFLEAITPRARPTAERRRLAAAIGESMTPTDVNISTHCTIDSTLEDELPRLTTPVLVLHPKDAVVLAKEESAAVAARVPHTRFALISGEFLYGDGDQGIQSVEAFLADLPPTEQTAIATGSRDGLSDRELEVLRLLAEGKSNPEIAKKLFITRNTVQNHVSSILLKTNLTNRAQAAVYAQQHGLV